MRDHDAGEPDPGDPRDQPRPHRAAHRCGWPTAASVSALEIQQEYLDAGERLRRRAAGCDTGSSSGCSTCGSARCAPSRTGDLGAGRPRDRLGHQAPADRALPGQARPGAVVAADRPPRPGLPRHPPQPRAVLPAGARAGWSSACRRHRGLRGRPRCRRRRRGPSCAGTSSARAQERRRDFTVDWVHLKLNDQAQRTVLCKDPFRAVDERVERLIESM